MTAMTRVMRLASAGSFASKAAKLISGASAMTAGVPRCIDLRSAAWASRLPPSSRPFGVAAPRLSYTSWAADARRPAPASNLLPPRAHHQVRFARRHDAGNGRNAGSVDLANACQRKQREAVVGVTSIARFTSGVGVDPHPRGFGRGVRRRPVLLRGLRHLTGARLRHRHGTSLPRPAVRRCRSRRPHI